MPKEMPPMFSVIRAMLRIRSDNACAVSGPLTTLCDERYRYSLTKPHIRTTKARNESPTLKIIASCACKLLTGFSVAYSAKASRTLLKLASTPVESATRYRRSDAAILPAVSAKVPLPAILERMKPLPRAVIITPRYEDHASLAYVRCVLFASAFSIPNRIRTYASHRAIRAALLRLPTDPRVLAKRGHVPSWRGGYIVLRDKVTKVPQKRIT